MEEWNMWKDEDFSFTDFIYKFPNGSYIELFGLEDEQKARGPGRDILFVNEANLIRKALFDQLAMRTTGTIFLDWNPADFVSWVYDVADNPNNKRIKSTYIHNKGNLSQTQIDIIEGYKNLPDDFMWKVYGLGERGAAKEIIYTKWQITDVLPEGGDVFYGLDFGYVHPLALVKVVHYEGANYVQELIYKSGLTPSEISREVKDHISDRKPVYCDAAEPKSIEELYRGGINAQAANKEVWPGILKVKSYPLFVTSGSKNIIRELQSYKWKKDKNDNVIDEPVKEFDDSCFIGETEITTINGQKRIDEIKVGDLVLTRNGYKKVLGVHNNGVKQVEKYLMQFDTHSVYLCCTSNHLIYTQNQWTKISKLESTKTVSHIKHLMAEDSHYIPEQGISQTGHYTCIGTFGSIIMGKGKKVTTYITKMVTHGITKYPILERSNPLDILANMQKNVLKAIPKSLKSFIQKESNQQSNGIKVQKELNGTNNMQQKTISVSHYQLNQNVCNAEKITSQKQSMQSSAIQTAKLKHFECVTSWQERVYDLTVEDEHEYFANGVLVHNCDAMRYAIFTHLHKPAFQVAVW
jgi:phage terminase large subunit